MSKRKRPKHVKPVQPPDPQPEKRVHFIFGKDMTLEQMAAEIHALHDKHWPKR